MAWARSQGNHAVMTSGGANWTLSGTVTSTSGGEDLLLFISWGTGTLTDLTSVKLGTTALTNVTSIADAGNSQSGAWMHLGNCASGQTTITAAGLQGGGAVLMIWDFFTGGSSTSTDGSHSRVEAATTSVTAGASFGASGDLIWGASMGDTVAGNLGAGAGWTAATTDNADAGFFGLSAMTIWQAATGAAQPTWTLSASGNYLTGGIAISTGGGGGFTAKARRTLSALGTRVGSRKTMFRRPSGLIVPSYAMAA